MVSWRKDTFLCNTAANPVSLHCLLQFQIDIYETFLRCTERILSMFHPSLTNISPRYLISRIYVSDECAGWSIIVHDNFKFNKAITWGNMEYFLHSRYLDFYWQVDSIFFENNERNYSLHKKFKYFFAKFLNLQPAWKAWGCESCLTSLPLPTGSYLTLLGLTGPYWALQGALLHLLTN